MNAESVAFGGLTVPFSSLVGNIKKSRVQYRTRSSPLPLQPYSLLLQTAENGNNSPDTFLQTRHSANPFPSQGNPIGIIGGVSVLSTLVFLEKFVWWSSKDGEESLPFIVCSDPSLGRKSIGARHRCDRRAENLRQKREFLEEAGARCIVMPCHLSHIWHGEISRGCSLPFLHVGDCVAMELKEANLRPLEGGSRVKIGVLATAAVLEAGFYQEKLRDQGFEAVVPDRATIERTVVPAIGAMGRRDMEGARNLLRIAIRILLVRAVNFVILASDEMHGLLPRDEPLLKKCVDPMDALGRSAVKWAKSTEMARGRT